MSECSFTGAPVSDGAATCTPVVLIFHSCGHLSSCLQPFVLVSSRCSNSRDAHLLTLVISRSMPSLSHAGNVRPSCFQAVPLSPLSLSQRFAAASVRQHQQEQLGKEEGKE